MKPAAISIIVGLVLISGALLAATTGAGGDASARARFQALDADGDARITPREAEAIAGLATHFSKFDRDGDGALTWSEYRRHAAAREVGS